MLIAAGRLLSGVVSRSVVPRWRSLRRVGLSLAGFGLVTAAAFQLSMFWGLLVGGFCVLLLEALQSMDEGRP